MSVVQSGGVGARLFPRFGRVDVVDHRAGCGPPSGTATTPVIHSPLAQHVPGRGFHVAGAEEGANAALRRGPGSLCGVAAGPRGRPMAKGPTRVPPGQALAMQSVSPAVRTSAGLTM